MGFVTFSALFSVHRTLKTVCNSLRPDEPVFGGEVKIVDESLVGVSQEVSPNVNTLECPPLVRQGGVVRYTQ